MLLLPPCGCSLLAVCTRVCLFVRTAGASVCARPLAAKEFPVGPQCMCGPFACVVLSLGLGSCFGPPCLFWALLVCWVGPPNAFPGGPPCFAGPSTKMEGPLHGGPGLLGALAVSPHCCSYLLAWVVHTSRSPFGFLFACLVRYTLRRARLVLWPPAENFACNSLPACIGFM